MVQFWLDSDFSVTPLVIRVYCLVEETNRTCKRKEDARVMITQVERGGGLCTLSKIQVWWDYKHFPKHLDKSSKVQRAPHMYNSTQHPHPLACFHYHSPKTLNSLLVFSTFLLGLVWLFKNSKKRKILLWIMIFLFLVSMKKIQYVFKLFNFYVTEKVYKIYFYFLYFKEMNT